MIQRNLYFTSTLEISTYRRFIFVFKGNPRLQIWKKWRKLNYQNSQRKLKKLPALFRFVSASDLDCFPTSLISLHQVNKVNMLSISLAKCCIYYLLVTSTCWYSINTVPTLKTGETKQWSEDGDNIFLCFSCFQITKIIRLRSSNQTRFYPFCPNQTQPHQRNIIIYN